ncbi:alpha/beta hydrolase [Mycobacterium sp. 852002-51163_SCH5372311]|uniref:alpha/beta hydrolase n=1 Tax=Mycobacterium sp. 852002-51163_SCH5372311 TaxID=1834097 RepID=UPI0007FD9113|nr:alpha/beta hydrolase [Mycobacterium sp. 852002-51163_SCH5372311]OBF86966.1 alpha/beta hydrolase [Mycobacterium sp. 852002-51163_SCH5372311]
MLEVVDKGAVTESHPAPLLFVHGAWHAAWCWDEHFLDFFADKGFRAVAVSLRGYGASSLSQRLNSVSVADYVDDIRSTVEMLGSEPVLIGHSLGGLLVQKYLENRRAPAAVLLASYPPQRRLRMAIALRAVLSHPWLTIRANLVGTTADLVNTAQLAREKLFCAGTPASTVESCAARLQPVSGRATGVLIRVRPSRVTIPVLVLDGESDATVTNDEVRATARAYRTQAGFFPDMGHNMMLEPGWQAVAERIEGWLAGQGL